MSAVVTRSLMVAAAVATALSTGAHATSTTAHAMVVSGIAGHPGGGEFDCATSGPQPLEGEYFGSASNGLPTEGYAYCHLAGGIQDTTNPSGISTATESVSNFFDGGVHNQTSAATADFGVLHAASSGSFTGSFGGGFTYAEGEAAAYSTDTIPVPVGAAFIQLSLSVDGTAAVTGNSQILSILDYQIDGGPIYGAFHADLIGNDFASVTGLNGAAGTEPLPGFTVSPTSLAGSGTVTSFLTAVSGPTFDLTLALLAASYPGYGAAADVDFSDTARLSRLSFFDAAGNPIAFGTLTGASGRLYDANGVHTAVGGVPEPASWALLIAGFGLVGLKQRGSRAAA